MNLVDYMNEANHKLENKKHNKLARFPEAQGWNQEISPGDDHHQHPPGSSSACMTSKHFVQQCLQGK